VLHAVSLKSMRSGSDWSSAIEQKPAPIGVPWKTQPRLSGKKPGSYAALTEMSLSAWRSAIAAPSPPVRPFATNRPSAELRIQ
jgi:hypothetical protein